MTTGAGPLLPRSPAGPVPFGPSHVAGSVNGTVPVLNGTVQPGNYISPDLSTASVFTIDARGGLGFLGGNVLDPSPTVGGGLDVVNLSTDHVVRAIPLPATPTAEVQASSNGLLYVVAAPLFQTGQLYIVNLSSSSVTKTLSLGSTPVSATYDPTNAEVYVAEYGSNQVAVVNTSTNTLDTQISVGTQPNLVEYAPASGYVYVANHGSQNLSVIAPSTNSVVATIPTGTYYTSIAYDSVTGDLYLAGASNGLLLTVVQGTTIAWNFTNPVSTTSNGDIGAIAFDPSDNRLYVTEAGCDIGAIDAATNGSLGTLLASQCVGGFGLRFDPGNGNLYAVVAGATLNALDWYPLAVYVISAASESVVDTFVFATQLSNGPGMAYDPHSRAVFVTDFGSDTVFVWNGSSRSLLGQFAGGYGPIGVAYDPGNNYLYIADTSSDAPSTAGHYVEVVNATTFALVAQIGINGYSAGYSGVAYDPSNGNLYFSGSQGGQVFVVDGATNQWIGTLSVAAGFSESGIAYDSLNGYLYMTDGSAGVAVIDPATPSVVSYLPVNSGTSILCDPMNGEVLVPWHIGGSGTSQVAIIDGTNNSIVENLSVAGGADGITYDPVDGTILVTGASGANLTGINASTDRASLYLDVGADPQGILYDPSTGEVYVANTYSGTLSIVDTGNRFPVTFEASGLPAGTTYTLQLGGVSVAATGASTVVYEPFGTYAFRIIPPTGYQVVPSSGQASVAPPGTNVTVAFLLVHPPAYPVTFTETGLAPGTNWAVDLFSASSGPSGARPQGFAYDSATGMIYVANIDSGNVTVYNGTTGYVVTSITTGSWPMAIAYDGKSGDLYVVNELSGNVSVIDGATNRIVGTISENVLPYGIAYDPSNDQLYMTGAATHNVLVIQASTNTVVSSIPLGQDGGGVLFDPANGEIYVGGSLGQILAISGSNDTVIRQIPTPCPGGLGYDAANANLYVSNDCADNATVVDTVTNNVTGSIAAGYHPSALLADPTDGYLFFANPMADAVTIVDPSTGGVVGTVPVGISPNMAGFDPATGSVYVLNTGGPNVTVLQPSYAGSSGSAVTFTAPNGPSAYFVTATGSYVAQPSSGVVVVNGRSVNTTVPFHAVTAARYGVSFTESGLATGTNWSVTLAPSTAGAVVQVSAAGVTHWSDGGPTVLFQVTNGTYNYTLAAPGLPAQQGTLRVNGTAPPAVQYVVAPAGSSGGSSPAPSVSVLEWAVLVGIAAAAVLGWAVVLLRRRPPSQPTGRTG